jgi:hypothetical protein
MARSKTDGKSATRRHQAARPVPSGPIGKRPAEARPTPAARPVNRRVEVPEEPVLTRAERRGALDVPDDDFEGSER